MKQQHQLLVEEGKDSPTKLLIHSSTRRCALVTTRSKFLVVLAAFGIVATVITVTVSFLVTRHTTESHGAAFFAPHAAVAADNPMCSTVGRKILEAGGHAVDGAIATALCQGVVHPFASGIGGGGIMLVYIHDENSTDTDLNLEYIDMREVAPAAATQGMYYSDPKKAATGPLSIAVPGEVKGLYYAWQRYGKLPWRDVVLPAANLALNFTVGKMLALFIEQSKDSILNITLLRDVYAPNGVLLKEGQHCHNLKLADTLFKIAEGGADVLYNGALGQQLAKDIQEAGGIITYEDLQNYEVVLRQPLTSYFMGYKMILPPPPYSGGVIALILNILERYNLGGLGYNAESMQWIVEAMKFGFADRLALGDPAYVNMEEVVRLMLDKDHAAVLRQKINQSETHPPSYYLDLTTEVYNLTEHGTSHLSVVDKDRNAVSFTTTINYNFGSKFVSEATGILLNDEMDDFSTSNSTNVWNLPPSRPNFVAPGKRPVSSMSPSMVFRDNELYMLAGANGGPRIITSTLQAYLNVLAFGKDLYSAVDAPRIHVQFTPPLVNYEAGLPQSIVNGLKEKGNEMVKFDYTTAVQAILVQEDGTLLAVSDHRKRGEPDGY